MEVSPTKTSRFERFRQRMMASLASKMDVDNTENISKIVKNTYYEMHTTELMKLCPSAENRSEFFKKFGFHIYNLDMILVNFPENPNYFLNIDTKTGQFLLSVIHRSSINFNESDEKTSWKFVSKKENMTLTYFEAKKVAIIEMSTPSVVDTEDTNLVELDKVDHGGIKFFKKIIKYISILGEPIKEYLSTKAFELESAYFEKEVSIMRATARLNVPKLELLFNGSISPFIYINDKEINPIMQVQFYDEEEEENMPMSIVDKMIKSGINLEFHDSAHGDTLLMGACQHDNPEMLTDLIKAGVDLNSVNNLKRTALMLACGYLHQNCAHILLDSGADFTLKDKKGKTAIRHSAFFNAHKICRFYEKFSNISDRNCELIELLLEKCKNVYVNDGKFNVVQINSEIQNENNDSKVQNMDVDVENMNSNIQNNDSESQYYGGNLHLHIDELKVAVEIVLSNLFNKDSEIQNTDSDAQNVDSNDQNNDSEIQKMDSDDQNMNSNIQTINHNLQFQTLSSSEAHECLIQYALLMFKQIVITNDHLFGHYNGNTLRCFYASVLKEFLKPSFLLFLKYADKNYTLTSIQELPYDKKRSCTKLTTYIKKDEYHFDIIGLVMRCLIADLYSCTHEENKGAVDVLTLTTIFLNFLSNDIPLKSSNDQVISPLTVLMSMRSHKMYCQYSYGFRREDARHDNTFNSISLVMIEFGSSTTQRLFRFNDPEKEAMAKELHLPDALYMALFTGKAGCVSNLLEYWHCHPFHLLLFADCVKSDRKFMFNLIIRLLKVGGPLPTTAKYYRKILRFIATLSYEVLNVDLYSMIKSISIGYLPSLQCLCRSVIRNRCVAVDNMSNHFLELPIPKPLAIYLMSPLNYNPRDGV